MISINEVDEEAEGCGQTLTTSRRVELLHSSQTGVAEGGGEGCRPVLHYVEVGSRGQTCVTQRPVMQQHYDLQLIVVFNNKLIIIIKYETGNEP